MKKTLKNIGLQVWRYGLVVVSLGTILVPFLWMIVSSFKPSGELFTETPRWIVHNMSFAGYEWAFSKTGGQIIQPLTNSIVISLMTTVMTIAISIMAGFAIARFKFIGLGAFLTLLFLCQVFQGPLIMIPWYRLASSLRIINTKAVLVLIYGTATIPVATMMLSGFFKTVPRDLEESAYLDGCNKWQSLIRIDLPIIRPGIVAVSVLTFITAWNDYQYALILTSSPSAKTIQIRINDIIQAVGNVNWSGLLAMGVVATLPAVIMFAIVQRNLIDGLTSGAVKG